MPTIKRSRAGDPDPEEAAQVIEEMIARLDRAEPQVEIETRIGRPPADVFAALADRRSSPVIPASASIEAGRADGLAVVFAAERLGAVFDDLQSVTPGQVEDGVHRRGDAAEQAARTAETQS